MYNVEVQNSCSCAIKKAIPEMQSFDTKEEAQEEANRLLQQMQDEFCKKHRFVLRNDYSSFIISILPNN